MLPFSKRTTTAVTVFACLFAAREAWRLTTVPAQIGALHQSHAQLFQIYRKVIHQDVANQESVLAGIITQAQAAIVNLNNIVQAIEPTMQNQTNEALPGVQLVCANAVEQINLVVATL